MEQVWGTPSLIWGPTTPLLLPREIFLAVDKLQASPISAPKWHLDAKGVSFDFLCQYPHFPVHCMSFDGGENLDLELQLDVWFSDFWNGGDVCVRTNSCYSGVHWHGVNSWVSYIWIDVLSVAVATTT